MPRWRFQHSGANLSLAHIHALQCRAALFYFYEFDTALAMLQTGGSVRLVEKGCEHPWDKATRQGIQVGDNDNVCTYSSVMLFSDLFGILYTVHCVKGLSVCRQSKECCLGLAKFDWTLSKILLHCVAERTWGTVLVITGRSGTPDFLGLSLERHLRLVIFLSETFVNNHAGTVSALIAASTPRPPTLHQA
jgi:hypothetical protein